MAKNERSRDLTYKIPMIATLFKAINCGEEIIIQMMKLTITLLTTLVLAQHDSRQLFYGFSTDNTDLDLVWEKLLKSQTESETTASGTVQITSALSRSTL